MAGGTARSRWHDHRAAAAAAGGAGRRAPPPLPPPSEGEEARARSAGRRAAPSRAQKSRVDLLTQNGVDLASRALSSRARTCVGRNFGAAHHHHARGLLQRVRQQPPRGRDELTPLIPAPSITKLLPTITDKQVKWMIIKALLSRFRCKIFARCCGYARRVRRRPACAQSSALVRRRGGARRRRRDALVRRDGRQPAGRRLLVRARQALPGRGPRKRWCATAATAGARVCRARSTTSSSSRAA